MAAPTVGITGFVQNVNNGISGFTVAYGTYTTATVSFISPPMPPGWVLSEVEVHWFVGISTTVNSSGPLTPEPGTNNYSFAINQPAGTNISVQVVFYVTPSGNLALTYASSPSLTQSNGVGTGITMKNESIYASPTTQLTVTVVMSGGGGMN